MCLLSCKRVPTIHFLNLGAGINQIDSLLGYCKELNASMAEEQKKRSVTFHYYFWKGNLQLWESSSMSKRQNRYFAASYFREAAKYADESRNRILLQKKAAKLLGSI